MSPAETSIWNNSLQQLRQYQEASKLTRRELSKEQVEDESQFMEQLFLTRKMHQEMLTILKKQDGHSSRVVASAMSKYGVDENVYHKGSIDGNHCIKLGQNGTEIVDEVTSAMRKLIKDSKNVEYLTKLDSSLKEMFELWFELMKIMKSVRRQTKPTIT